MDALQARPRMIVEDEKGNTFEVLAYGKKVNCLKLQSVVTKEVWPNVDASKVEPVEGLRAR